MKLVEADFRERRNFAAFMTARGITEAIEIGTDRGVFARQLLSGWDGFLWCIDSYEPYSEMCWDRSLDMAMAVQVLTPFLPRVRIVRMRSRDFAEKRREVASRVGLVYIDADHEEDAVRDDLAVWWETLRPGGILAGHDLGDHHPGVERALTPLAEAHDLTVRIVRDYDAHSWYVEKPFPTESE